MKLSTRVRYATRALVVLARCQEPCTSETIAQAERLSKKYMDEILGALRQGGILHTKRGVSGGYTLAVPLADISLLRVAELLDGPVRLAPCVEDETICPRQEVCLMGPVWARLNDAVRESFAAVSMEDIVTEGEVCTPSLSAPAGLCSRRR